MSDLRLFAAILGAVSVGAISTTAATEPRRVTPLSTEEIERNRIKRAAARAAARAHADARERERAAKKARKKSAKKARRTTRRSGGGR